MDKPVLLWVDFARPGRQSAIPAGVEEQCILHRVVGPDDIDAKVQLVAPDMICFEFDYPDHSGLMALVETKQAHPTVPIIMLTEQTSEALAVWALRSRVWDYLVKPVTVDDILYPVNMVQRIRQQPKNGTRVFMPKNKLPNDLHKAVASSSERAVQKAKMFIERHLEQALTESMVAKHCNMSTSHFSRMFKKHCGIGFSEHVLRLRINKGAELLIHSGNSITGIAYDVGFRDPSYFARVFKRYIGMCPSQYQEEYKTAKGVTFLSEKRLQIAQ